MEKFLFGVCLKPELMSFFFSMCDAQPKSFSVQCGCLQPGQPFSAAEQPGFLGEIYRQFCPEISWISILVFKGNK